MYIRSTKTGRESFLKARQNLAEVISRTYNYNLQSSIDIPSGIPDMTEFLRTVAKHYFGSLLQSGQGKAHPAQWTDWMFVFPNRRAGLFFKQYLCELNGNKPLLAPQCISIGDIFALLAEQRVANRTELLFRLYKVYQQVRSKGQEASTAEKFEDFIFWGEMLLRDFDEVDKYLVPADLLFRNVRDLKQIDEEFGELDEETLSVIRTFWSNVNPKQAKDKNVKANFEQTWAILYEVYSTFRNTLRKEGMAYEGMRQRSVVERLAFEDAEALKQRLPARIVLVGITAINKAERTLLLWLKKEGLLECCWDYAFENVKSLPFVKENLADFGNALSPEECLEGIVPVEKKVLKRVSVPSGVGQADSAAAVLRQWVDQEAFHTAVVLPDEHLLYPVLYSLPSAFQEFNVTMGYSLRSTPVASLVEALIFLQRNINVDAKGNMSFFYKAVLPILSHSFLLELQMTECSELAKDINRRSLFRVPQSMLKGNALFQLIFQKKVAISYLQDILQYFLRAFRAQEEEEKESSDSLVANDRYILNRECIIGYLQVIDQVEKELKEAQMESLDDYSLFHLIHRLAQGQSVSFSGEPMKGLQIMGVLETRAVDFERIVILSMNEGVVPAKAVNNSFVPYSLRRAFGLPTQMHKDYIFSYHFYRLISRAKEVVFLYDSRTDGMQTGEQSRYLMQLQYLYGTKLIDMVPAERIFKPTDQSVTVAKDERVMQQLNEFKAGGELKLSASNLKTYITCPLQFYFAHVCGLSVDEEMDEELADAAFGDIMHRTLMVFYQRLEGQQVQDDVLKKALNHPDYLLDLVKKEYKRQFSCEPETGYQLLICSLIEANVRSVLEHDRELTPFRYLAGESRSVIAYPVNDSLSVNLTTVYDRVDIVVNKDKTSTLRIVDYKTGNPKGNKNKDKVKVSEKEIDNITGHDSTCSKEAFQVLLYCLMLDSISKEDQEKMHLSPRTPENAYQQVQPNLYFTRQFLNQDVDSETVVLPNFTEWKTTIQEQVNHLIEEIFDPSVAFVQTEDEDNCKYCKFLKICNKNTKDD